MQSSVVATPLKPSLLSQVFPNKADAQILLLHLCALADSHLKYMQ